MNDSIKKYVETEICELKRRIAELEDEYDLADETIQEHCGDADTYESRGSAGGEIDGLQKAVDILHFILDKAEEDSD